MPTCALSTAGKAAIDAAAAGELDLGNFKIGATPGAVIGVDSTDVVGALSYTGAAADILWASFGSGKLNLYLRLYGTTQIEIGNIIIYLSDNVTPLAFLTFDQKLVKRANTANKAQDSILLVVSLQRANISGKFDIPSIQSRNFALPVFQTRQVFDASRDLFGVIATFPEMNNQPVTALKINGELWINPIFNPTDLGETFFPIITGGSVGDGYVETEFDWTMEWV